jgi:hypothetical protein
MPVEFLTDDEAAAYGRYVGTPSQAHLDRVFFLDDDDLKLVRKHRGEHMRAGFALQLVTVRWLGKFLEDPLDVPDGVLEFVACKQLGMADLTEVKRYVERGHTRFDHQWEIKNERGYREFDDAGDEFAQWVAARSRATGDGPKAIFTDGLAWLRQRNILLPGVTTLARLVASVGTRQRASCSRNWPRSRIRSSGARLTGCWRYRPGRGCRTWNGGARAQRRAGAARRW